MIMHVQMRSKKKLWDTDCSLKASNYYKMNPARPQLVITFKLLKHSLFGILDLGFLILGFYDFWILDCMILGLLFCLGFRTLGFWVSHVTVSGAWRDKGNSVTCNGFWGLEGQGK